MTIATHVIRQDSKFIARAGRKVLGTFDSEIEAQSAVNRYRADSRGLTGEPEDQERDNEEDGDEDADENDKRAFNGAKPGKSLPQKGTGYGTETKGEPTGAEDDADEDGDDDADEGDDEDEDGDADEDGDDDHDEPGSGRGGGFAILARVHKTHKKDVYDKMSPHAIVGAYRTSRKEVQKDLDTPDDVTHNQVMSHMTGAEY